MKLPQILMLAFTLAFLIPQMVNGQKERERNIPLSVTPFSQGITSLDLNNNLDLSFLTRKTENNNAIKIRGSGIHLSATHFLIDNVGVGIGINTDRHRNFRNEIETISSINTGSLHAIYGKSFNEGLNIYTKTAFRGGFDKYKYNSPLYEQDQKRNILGFNWEVGALFDISNGNGAYFNPFISYDYSTSKDEDYKDIYSGLFLGTKLNLSLPCASYAHDCDQVNEFSEDMYTQGTNSIGGGAYFQLNFGNERYRYMGENGNGSSEPTNSFSSGSLNGEYLRYIYDNIAVGGNLWFQTYGQNDKNSDDKVNSVSWMLTPIIQVNLPVTGTLHNSFGYVGYGIGSSKVKTTYFENTDETKEKNSSFEIGIGHNIFIANNFALVPKASYKWFGTENTDEETKTTTKGLEFNLSFRQSF